MHEPRASLWQEKGTWSAVDLRSQKCASTKYQQENGFLWLEILGKQSTEREMERTMWDRDFFSVFSIDLKV